MKQIRKKKKLAFIGTCRFLWNNCVHLLIRTCYKIKIITDVPEPQDFDRICSSMASAPPLQLKSLGAHEAFGFLTHSFTAPFLYSGYSDASKLSTYKKVWQRSKALQCDSAAFVRLSNILMSINHLKGQVYAARRMLYTRSETYVLLEPGKDEIFMTLEELKERLKGWLERWPGNKLPANLNKFNNLDDAVTHLVKSGCELEVDGGLGSIQWYEVDIE